MMPPLDFGEICHKVVEPAEPEKGEFSNRTVALPPSIPTGMRGVPGLHQSSAIMRIAHVVLFALHRTHCTIDHHYQFESRLVGRQTATFFQAQVDEGHRKPRARCPN
jgi:hypothetical protein